MNNKNIEGYWNNKANSYPQYPLPVHREKPYFGKSVVLKRLSAAQDQAEVIRYRGWSTCRCCGENLGNEEYVFDGWRWPGGFEHYVRIHNVKPSNQFMAFLKLVEMR